jgi:tetratricopeptide (TPR) repeat protein
VNVVGVSGRDPSDANAPTEHARDPGTLTTDMGIPLDAEPGIALDERYREGEEIGRGGGGRVVRAVDRRLDRPVALKVPVAAEASSRARLEREARVMARLEHPGIVPVHDAGRLVDGTPYYAMKLLGGRTLRDVVRAATTLDERLVLAPHVLAVAEAVAYAHSRRVIHRDLKPANVLVGEFGETVVIDWGLAKDLAATGDDAITLGGGASFGDQTEAGAVMGTPQYMPPEQARGEVVDERADVYALGAILYDLLAGAPPYPLVPGESVLARVLAEPPPPLAEVAPGAPRDLIAIAETAMARDPRARYRTAIELADDLRRYLGGRLVAAHHYSAAALARRWVRRHRGAVAIGAVALAAVATIGVISARRVVAARDRAEDALATADRARAVAEARRVGAEELIDFMLFDLRDRLKPIGKLDALGGVGAKVDAYYRTVAATADGDEPATVRRRARALAIVSDVAQKRGDLEGALAPARLSLALATRLAPLGTPDDLQELVTAWLMLGDIFQQESRIDDARAAYRIALRIAERMAAASPASEPWAWAVAKVHSHLGRLANNRGDQPTMLAEYGAVRAALASLVARGGATQEMEGLLAVSEGKLADGAYDAGDFAGAQAAYEDQREVRKRILAEHPDDAGARRGVAQTTLWIGMTKMMRGQLDGAAADFHVADGVFRELVAQDPENVEWLGDLSDVHEQLAQLDAARGDHRAQLADDQVRLDAATALAAHAPADLDSQRGLALAWVDLGEVQGELGDRAAEEKAFRRALAIMDPLAAHDPGNLDWAADRGEIRAMLAGLLGSGAEARALAAEARRILDELRAKGHDNPEVRDLAERMPKLDALR